MNFYIENNFDGDDDIEMSVLSNEVQPLDLSRRGSVNTENTTSDRSSSPPENFYSINDPCRNQPSHSIPQLIGSPLFIRQQHDTPSPVWPFIQEDNRQDSFIMAMALNQILAQSIFDYPVTSDSSNPPNNVNQSLIGPFNQYSSNIFSGMPMNVVGSDTNSKYSYSSTDSVKDAAYYERRKKNNAAAKMSRLRRKLRQEHIAMMAMSAEIEYNYNVAKLAAAKKELEELIKLDLQEGQCIDDCTK